MMHFMSTSNSVPPLENIALIRIATRIWNQNDILLLIEKFVRESDRVKCRWRKFNSEAWKNIESRVTRTGQKVLPKYFHHKIDSVIRGTGQQIVDWSRFLQKENIFFPVTVMLKQICWTSFGTVDKLKTAEMLIMDHRMCFNYRCKIAEILYFGYCPELKSVIKRVIKNEDKNFGNLQYSSESCNVFLHHLSEGYAVSVARIGIPLESRVQRFSMAACDGNIMAVKFFWETFDVQERNIILISRVSALVLGCRCERSVADVLRFLLSVMPESQHEMFLEENAERILLCFLECPWQDYFMKYAEIAKYYLSQYNYSLVLLKTLIAFQKNYYFEEVFISFCHQKPHHLHKSFVDEILCEICLSTMEEKKSITCLSLILDSIRDHHRKEFIFSKMGMNRCHFLICNNRLNFVMYLLREFLKTNKKAFCWKRKFRQYVKNRRSKLLCFIHSQEDVCTTKKSLEVQDRRNRKKCRKFFKIFDNMVKNW